jgi:hypothetical protein
MLGFSSGTHIARQRQWNTQNRWSEIFLKTTPGVKSFNDETRGHSEVQVLPWLTLMFRTLTYEYAREARRHEGTKARRHEGNEGTKKHDSTIER